MKLFVVQRNEYAPEDELLTSYIFHKGYANVDLALVAVGSDAMRIWNETETGEFPGLVHYGPFKMKRSIEIGNMNYEYWVRDISYEEGG